MERMKIDIKINAEVKMITKFVSSRRRRDLLEISHANEGETCVHPRS